MVGNIISKCEKIGALEKSVAIIDFDVHGKIIEVNDNYLALTGYTRDEIIGRHHSIFLSESEAASEEYQLFWAELRSGQFQSAEFRRIGKDGKIFWIRGSYNPVFDEKGNLVRVVKFAMDITERKELESRLLAASQAKDLFLANISHELRTPLNGMIGVLDALGNTRLTRRQNEMVRLISDSGQTLEKVLADMLDITRIEAGKVSLEFRPLRVRSEIEAAIYFQRECAIEKGLEFRFIIDDGVPSVVRLDPTRVKQVVANLISNAVKFTDTGSVELRVGFKPTDGEGVISFRVTDTGIGLDESRASELFMPFTQADPSISRRFGGTGLGLAICRSLAIAMHGALTVQSALGVGSVFTFEAPCGIEELDEPISDEGPERGALIAALKPKVLVVDDHPSNRLVMELMLMT